MQCVTDADGYRIKTNDTERHKSARTPIVKGIMLYKETECWITSDAVALNKLAFRIILESNTRGL